MNDNGHEILIGRSINRKESQMNTRHLKVMRTGICICLPLIAATVQAGFVNDSNSSNDPRYITTGCKYEGSLTSGGSIGIWVKNISSYANNGAVVFGSCHINSGMSNDQGLLLNINSYGDFVFRVAGSKSGEVVRHAVTAEGSSVLLNDGSWHFLFGTFDVATGKMNFYVDGKLVNAVDIDIDGLVSSRCFTVAGIGKKAESANVEKENYAAGFKGLYAEVTVWSKALTADYVSELFKRRAYPWDDGLVGYWPLAKNSRNLAMYPAFRNDGTVPDAQNYYRMKSEDPAFFADPPTRFVASAEWTEKNGYVQSPTATFGALYEPATNVTEAVKAACSSAMDGEVVCLMPGTHYISSSANLQKENLTVTGKYQEWIGGGAIIDAQNKCRHFISSSVSGGKSGFVLENLTLLRGCPGGDIPGEDVQRGGSMYFNGRSGVVRNCVFQNNSAISSGGAINSYVANGTIVSNCVFSGNTAVYYGGAFYAQQNAQSPSDKCIIVDCVVTNNTAARGGGIYAERCIEIRECYFADNAAATGSEKRGGAVCAGVYSTIADCVFTGGSAATYGSCIDISGRKATISGCSFAGLNPSGNYGVIHVKDVSDCVVSDCVFTNLSWSGIQLFFPEGANSSLVVRQSLIGENAGSGAVIGDYLGASRFENCTVLPSSFDAKSRAPARNVLVNCIVPHAGISSEGDFVNILSNCCVKVVPGGAFDSSVFAGDPKFADAATGDYRLKASSKCREAGLVLDWMTETAVDLDGRPRIAGKDGKALSAGALPDLGCYECDENFLFGLRIVVR